MRERSRNAKEMAGIADFAVDIVATAGVTTPGDGFGGVVKIANGLFDQGMGGGLCPVRLRAHSFVPVHLSSSGAPKTPHGLFLS